MEVREQINLILSRYSVLISVLGLLVAMVGLMSYYSRRLRIAEVMTIVVLSSIAVIGRMAFFFIPFFTPITAIIIITGSVFGPWVGCFVGALSAILSNFVFGQGTWTPFQMFCWSVIGGLSFPLKRRVSSCLYGFALVLLFYGPVMNMYSMLISGREYSLNMAILFEIHGFPADIIHAISTVTFLWFGWDIIRKKLVRMKAKYGVLSKQGMYKEEMK